MSKLLDRIKTEKIAIQCGTVEEAARVQVITGGTWVSSATDKFLLRTSVIYLFKVVAWWWDNPDRLPEGFTILPATTFLAEYDSEQRESKSWYIEIKAGAGDIGLPPIEMQTAMTPQPVTGKKDTPLQIAIASIQKDQDENFVSEVEYVKELLQSLLPAEREAIEGAYKKGKVNMVVRNSAYKDCNGDIGDKLRAQMEANIPASDYFNQTFNQ